jgi:hypothetical protein
MKDPSSSPARSRGKAAALFGIGLLSGATLGLLFGGGRFARDAETAAEASPEKSALTYGGTAVAKGPSGDPLGALLGAGAIPYGGYNRAREVLEFVEGLKPGDLAGQIDAIFARDTRNRGYDLIKSLYQKWVEEDPAAALRHAEGLKGRDRKIAFDFVLSAWAAKEPYEVLAWIEEQGEGIENQSTIHTALRTIAQENPEEAIAYFESRKMHLSGDQIGFSGGSSFTTVGLNTGFLYGIWAEKDPKAAAAAVLSIPNVSDRKNALFSIAAQWAMADPRAVWDWGNGLERVSERDAVLGSVVRALLGNDDTGQAIAFLEAMPPGENRRQALGQIANLLANSDPERAYEFVRSQALSSGAEQVYSSILSQWARTDPSRAFKVALDELDPGDARHSALQSVLHAVVKRDTALALEMVGKLDDGDLLQVSSTMAHSLARDDRSVAIAWAETLPDGEIKQNAFSSILSEWAQEAPDVASAYSLKIADESVRRRSLGTALRQWGQADAVEALTWAVTNLGKEDQEKLIPDLLGSWANQDLVAAGEWLKQLPSGQGRDSAVQKYAPRVFDSDPEAALAWSESIGNESNRLSQMEYLARRYLRNSPEQARRWIANSSLPPERKEAMLKAVERN